MKMEGLKNFFSGLFGEGGKNKRVKWILALGLAGIALIGVSELPGRKGEQKPAAAAPAANDAEAYAGKIEARLTQTLKSIEGVGDVEILVTLEGTAEKVYAQEEKRTSDKAQDAAGASSPSTQERTSVEQKYILVDGESGKREALLLTQVEPKVKGVVVVCDGADQIQVEQKVVETVTTALNISSNRVCVAKKNH